MNAKTLAKHYDRLTPEECFRLLVAASGRGDVAERDRLARASEKIALSFPAYFGFSQAFNEMSLMVYLELLDLAATYRELNEAASDALDIRSAEDPDGEGLGEQAEGDDGVQEQSSGYTFDEETRPRSSWERLLELTYATGFLLRTKAEGWKLFCQGLNIPPLLLWQELPGFDRLQRMFRLTEQAAYQPEGFLRWLNRIRPSGAPEQTHVPSVEGTAAATEAAFRQRARWWTGD